MYYKTVLGQMGLSMWHLACSHEKEGLIMEVTPVSSTTSAAVRSTGRSRSPATIRPCPFVRTVTEYLLSAEAALTKYDSVDILKTS